MIKLKNAVLRALLALTIAGMPVMASAGGGVSVKATTEEKTAIVSLADIEGKQVSLSVEDEYERVIYYSAYVKNTADFTRLFDFSLLEDGNYVIVVKWENEIRKQPISIKDQKVVVKELIKMEEPLFRVTGDDLLIFFNNKTEQKFVISIAGEDGVFFTDNSQEKDFARKYNLSQLPEGTYNISVSNNDQQFHYTVHTSN